MKTIITQQQHTQTTLHNYRSNVCFSFQNVQNITNKFVMKFSKEVVQNL